MRINLTDPRLSPTASCLSKRGRRPKPTCPSVSDQCPMQTPSGPEPLMQRAPGSQSSS